MKKYVKYFAIFLFVIFILPAICTKSEKKDVVKKGDNNELQEFQKYDYSKYAKIKLYNTYTKKTEEIDFDEYLYGTVSAEMPASYEMEALKAQAVVSRTYTLYQIKNNNKHEDADADICDNYGCCQAWISKEDRLAKWEETERESNWKKIKEAVDSTSGKIITYNGEPINAFFHSNSGGTTEAVSSIWGEKEVPYLQSVETVGEDSYKQYKSELTLSKNELVDKMKTKYPDIDINWEEKECINIIEYTDSKRVKTLKIGNKEIAGTEVRSLLGLKSTNFTYKIEDNKIIFSVIGYGHGVGMSQTGADSMAKSGSKFEEIIKHFYTGVDIKMVN